jgi:serine/threonine protein kinase
VADASVGFDEEPAPVLLRVRTLEPGMLLAGRYEIEGCIGHGGMATVYRARQLSLGREVAIKVLDRPGAHAGLARFSAEARITAELHHSNVVNIFDFGTTEEGVVFMVMELLEGEDLRARLQREGPMPWAEAREVMLQICAGLAAAHGAGITHRDLKPANCFCVDEPDGVRIRLLDFGIARPTQRLDGQRLTLENRVLGTPEYMAPEQARCEKVDARSDVYAAGIILGELLTGRVPFEEKSAEAVIGAHIYKPAPKLRELGGVGFDPPPGVEAIYERALRKDPAERFESISAMGQAIAAVDPQPVSWARRLLASLAACVVGGLLT